MINPDNAESLALEQVAAKTIVQRTRSTAWFGTEYNMNIYRGCPHGCIYCDSRSDCYGTADFDCVRVKENALSVIRDDLRRKVKPGVVATGAMSDPYNPHENNLMLTRRSLELLSAFDFGAAIATKSSLVLRDIDILQEIKEHSPALVKITITTPHDSISEKIEPYAPKSSRRFATLKELSKNGIFCGVLLMPVLPFISDNPQDIARLVYLAADAGARFVYPFFGVTLRQNQREYFLKAAEEVFPGARTKYLKQYGNNYNCVSPHRAKLQQAFDKACAETGMLYKMRDIIAGYKKGYGDNQLKWF